MKNKDGSLSSCRSWGENTTFLKPSQHNLRIVILVSGFFGLWVLLKENHSSWVLRVNEVPSDDEH